MNRLATSTLDQAATAAWDVMVIGAGPSGLVAAYQAARAGLRTLIVEKKSFPRAKVCGGCISHRALESFRALDLEPTVVSLHGSELSYVRILSGKRQLDIPIPRGLAITRATLDEALLKAAIQAGAEFLDNASATVEPYNDSGFRYVTISCHSNNALARDGDQTSSSLSSRSLHSRLLSSRSLSSRSLSARAVLCADGLGHSSVKGLRNLQAREQNRSRVGVGTVLEGAAADYEPSRIFMCVARDGYVGITAAERQRLIIAAAVNPASLHGNRAISERIARVMEASRLPAPSGLTQANWLGTPPLSSRPQLLAAERLFVVGDAAGYIEPFTGEGIAWALESAIAVHPLVLRACRAWQPSLVDEWHAVHDKVIQNRQRLCRRITTTLKHPWAAATAMNICRLFPPAAHFLVAQLNTPARVGVSLSRT